MTHPTLDARSLIAAWRAAGLLPQEAEAAVAAALLSDAAQERPPLHLKLLSALGTVLAMAFFLSFLVVSGLISFNSAGAVLSWGLVFLAAGLALALAGPRAEPGLRRDMLALAAFTTMAIGKVMTVMGLIGEAGSHTHWVPTAAVLAVTVITYPVSGSSLDRILSPYAVGVAALVEIFGLRSFATGPGLPLTVLYGLATLIAGATLLSHRVPLALRPLGIAALGVMGTIVCIVALGLDAGRWAGLAALDPRLIEAMLTLSLVAVIAWAAGGVDHLRRPPLAAAVAGAVLLGFAGAPGISFALLLLIVGHALHDMPVRVAGVLALPAFLVLWYYGRDMTFLEKSAALVASGAVLLAGRAVMARAGWDREVAP